MSKDAFPFITSFTSDEMAEMKKNSQSTQCKLDALSERTQYMLGGKLDFKPVEGFVTRTHEPDGEMLVPGYILSKSEPKKFFRNKAGEMDSRKLEQSMKKVFEWLDIEYDMQRTEKGLWVGTATIERMLDAYSIKEIDEDKIGDLPGGPLPGEYFARAFLTAQGKTLSR